MREDIKINSRVQDFSQEIIEKLEHVIDPELELDIYNLGLIYEISIDDHGLCQVVITFTETHCDCSDTIPPQIIEQLKTIDGIKEVEVKVVWEPVWNPTRLSRYGRIFLGINPN